MQLSLLLISGLTTLALAAPVAKLITEEKRGLVSLLTYFLFLDTN